MVICDTREENYNDNSTRNGKPEGKLTKGAKKWTAQFMQKYKAEREASTAKNQEQTTGNDRTEKDTTEIQKEEGDEADIEETDTQRKKQANKALWKKRIPTTITIGTEYRKTNKIERCK